MSSSGWSRYADETEGLSYFAEFAAVAKPFTVPADQLSRPMLARLTDFLNDETVPPHLIRRLAAQYPDTVDQVFATLLLACTRCRAVRPP